MCKDCFLTAKELDMYGSWSQKIRMKLRGPVLFYQSNFTKNYYSSTFVYATKFPGKKNYYDANCYEISNSGFIH